MKSERELKEIRMDANYVLNKLNIKNKGIIDVKIGIKAGHNWVHDLIPPLEKEFIITVEV